MPGDFSDIVNVTVDKDFDVQRARSRMRYSATGEEVYLDLMGKGDNEAAGNMPVYHEAQGLARELFALKARELKELIAGLEPSKIPPGRLSILGSDEAKALQGKAVALDITHILPNNIFLASALIFTRDESCRPQDAAEQCIRGIYVENTQGAQESTRSAHALRIHMPREALNAHLPIEARKQIARELGSGLESR